MPPRLNKRQQRELEELQALGSKPDDAIHDNESDDGPQPATTKAASGFAAVSIVAYIS